MPNIESIGEFFNTIFSFNKISSSLFFIINNSFFN